MNICSKLWPHAHVKKHVKTHTFEEILYVLHFNQWLELLDTINLISNQEMHESKTKRNQSKGKMKCVHITSQQKSSGYAHGHFSYINALCLKARMASEEDRMKNRSLLPCSVPERHGALMLQALQRAGEAKMVLWLGYFGLGRDRLATANGIKKEARTESRHH